VHQQVVARDAAERKRVRACIDCGEPESRQEDRVNLDPVSGRCVKCLIAYAKAGFKSMPSDRDQTSGNVAYDWRHRAAGERE
jgi:hypothetical protein